MQVYVSNLHEKYEPLAHARRWS